MIDASIEVISLPECDLMQDEICSSMIESDSIEELESIENCCIVSNKPIRKALYYCWDYFYGCNNLVSRKPDFTNWYLGTTGYYHYSSGSGISFPLWSYEKSVIYGSDNTFKLIAAKPMTAHFKKGQYFDGGQYLMDSPDIYLNYRFILCFWIKSLSSSSFFLFSKGKITVVIDLNNVNIISSSTLIITTSFRYNEWNSMNFRFDIDYFYGSVENSDVELYTNDYFKYGLFSSAFTSEASNFYLGGNTVSPYNFKGWI